jgi:ribonuclease T2
LVCRSPTFCADVAHDKEFQCHEKNSFGLIVHGLWPQTSGSSSVRDQPRNCRNEQQLPFSIIKRFYCMMPDEDLMQAEWEKHGKIIQLSHCIEKKHFLTGSCYYATATDYFTAIEYLFNQLNIPNIREMKQPTFSSIKNAFLTLNSPELFASAIYVYMDKQGRLNEIRICYDLQYKFISCQQ